MCFASRYSEQHVCDVTSYEQQKALHCDYLDAQRIRFYCVQNYFGSVAITEIKNRTRDLVTQYAGGIALVAERLLAGETLNHDRVVELINEADTG
jgi:hypothetical protein